MNLLKAASIPRPVRILTHATSIHWAGWGFAEPLLAVFVFLFAGTHAGAGLLWAISDIVFVLALPVAGLAADRFRPIDLAVISLILFSFLGVGYFLAGVLGQVLFIVITRLLSGPAYALDIMGRETYIRQQVPKERSATVFGYFDTTVYFWWIVGAFAGAVLIRYFEIHELLLLIAPAALIAAFIMNVRLRRKGGPKPKAGRDNSRLRSSYAEMFREMRRWQKPLRLLAVFNFFIAFGSTAVAFSLPIEAYIQGIDLSRTMLIAVALATPGLFGWLAGRWFDNKGPVLFLYGLMAFGVIVGLLALNDSYLLKLAVALGVGVILELLSVGSRELATMHSEAAHFGRVGSIMRTVFYLGGALGPLSMGVLVGWLGASPSFSLLAALMFVLAGIFWLTRKTSGLGLAPAVAKPARAVHQHHHKEHTRRGTGMGPA